MLRMKKALTRRRVRGGARVRDASSAGGAERHVTGHACGFRVAWASANRASALWLVNKESAVQQLGFRKGSCIAMQHGVVT